MTDISVTERRIRPIQDAIRANNWKQALKECEKWQKKGETSDRFLTLRTLVLLHQADDKNVQNGATETIQLCTRPSPVVDIEAIHQLQDALALLKLDAEEGPKLFERAVKSRPNDKDLMTTWLHDAISSSNWQSAQKATTALKKAFPDDRKYDFWNVLMCLSIHQDEAIPEQSRKLFGTLASRMITKAAETSPSDKAIGNVEELSLLANVLTGMNDADTFIELCQRQSLQSVIEEDRAFVETLLLKALKSSSNEELKQQTIKSLLRADGPEPSDDDRLWDLVLQASVSNMTAAQESLNVVDRILGQHPQHRNALLARVQLLAGNEQSQTAKQSAVIEACLVYYQKYGVKAFCFNDMMRALQSCNPDVIVHLSDQLSNNITEKQPAAQLFNLKLNLYLAMKAGLNQQLLVKCIQSAFDLYEPPSHVSTEAAYIAAIGLVYLSLETQNKEGLLQANLFLRHTSMKFKDYYPLRVLLLLVQRLSGQIHLSMETFWRLSIKNIQWETAGYLLLERVATLHPRQYGREDDSLNPLGATDAALTVFSNSERSLDRAIREGLKNGSYSNVTDTLALRKRLQASMSRQLCMLEERKIQRLLGYPVIPKFEVKEGKRVDLRDTAFLPTYGLSDEKWKNMLLGLPRPGDGWIEVMNMHEILMSYFATQLNTTPSGIVAFTLDALLKALEKTTLNHTDLSQAEQQATAVYIILAEVVLCQEKKLEKDVTVETLIKGLHSLEKAHETPKINGVEHVDADWLHHHFVWFEVLQTVAVYLTVLTAKSKASGKTKPKLHEGMQQSQKQLRTLISSHAETVQKIARKVRDGLGQPGVLGKLVDAALGRSIGEIEPAISIGARLAEFGDEAVAEEYCNACRDSWEDALDGLLAVKVKI